LPRPTYNHEWETVLAYDDRGEPVRSIAYRLQVEHGQYVRFAVALRIRSGPNDKLRDSCGMMISAASTGMLRGFRQTESMIGSRSRPVASSRS
jgi:hypothetical protein